MVFLVNHNQLENKPAKITSFLHKQKITDSGPDSEWLNGKEFSSCSYFQEHYHNHTKRNAYQNFQNVNQNKFLLHSIPHLYFPLFLVEWKVPPD